METWNAGLSWPILVAEMVEIVRAFLKQDHRWTKCVSEPPLRNATWRPSEQRGDGAGSLA